MAESTIHAFSGRLIVGTHNRKKGVELAEMLAPWGIQVVTLDDVASAIEVSEDGNSFAANAVLKASQQAKHLGQWVVADDSGLEVNALGGAPGIYSARYAALSDAGGAVAGTRPGSADDANNARLLSALGDTPLDQRAARYVCHVAVADPTGTIRAESHDFCGGRIRLEASGGNGFGYDPLFEVVEYHRTFGELGPAVKRAISHRSRAMRAILPQLVALKN